jgi:hypothetical protein
MVREERAAADKRMIRRKFADGVVADLRVQALLQCWYESIKEKLPEGSSLVANMQGAAKNGFLVSFRAETESETFISEARDAVPSRAVEEAGESLYLRLLNPSSEKITIKDRLLRIFSEAS